MKHSILIIGGGAAGLAAALSAARSNPDAQITVLEGLDRIGKKILATGNGRCNLSNESILPMHYHSQSPARLEQLLSDMSTGRVLDFFESVGLYCTAEDMGRIYPYSKQAVMVLDVLRLALERSGIRLVCGCKITGISRRKNRFAVTSADGQQFYGDRVILTTGGRAAPKQGTDGSGYPLVRALGHRCTPLYPCLVPLQCSSPVLKGLKGIRAVCRITLSCGRTKLAEELGELQFTDYGLSGIPALQLSCCLGRLSGGEPHTVGIDLLPDWSYDTLRTVISQRTHRCPGETLETFLLGLINKRILYAVFKTCSLPPLSHPAASLSKKDVDRLISALKNWKFPVTGTLSWDHAQVTGGGVPLTEIDNSFASVKCPGLYLAGEILDTAGDCGGYNLHWAWCSGMTAGAAAAQY